ncbi:MAG: T9SS type A sorting domain-containing protein [Bacteroidia bacterium]
MMKNYLLCILIGLPTFLQAQTLPTQTQSYVWNSALFDWVLGSAESYQYDERDSVRVTDTQSNWFGPFRVIHTKDESGKVVESLYLGFDANNVWTPSQRSTTTSSAADLDILLTESWLDGQWQAQNRSLIRTKTIAAGIEIDRQFQIFTNGEWVYTTRYLSVRNEEDVVSKERHFEWRNNAWEETLFWEYQYNAQGDPIYFEHNNVKDAFISRNRWEYTYNDAMQLLTQKLEEANSEPPVWTIRKEESYEYDSEGRELLNEQRIFNSHTSINRQETEYRGDTIITSRFRGTNNSQLEGVWRYWRVPAPQENAADTYYRNDAWKNGQWKPRSISRRNYQFDQYDNVTRIDFEEYVNGQWEALRYYTHNWEYREDGEPLKVVSLEYNYNTQLQIPINKTIWRYEDRKERSARPLIEIAPNPSTGQLSVDFHSAPVPPIRWELLDETGRLVRSGEISKDAHKLGIELDFDELQFGLYIFQIQYEDGSTVAKKWQKI